MACCGSTCTITGTEFADATVEGHSFTVNFTSNEQDVRSFDSGDYGDWLACGKSGDITVNSYIRPAVVPGDTVTFAANVCASTISVDCVITGQTWNIDSKGIVDFNTTMRMNDNATIG